MNKDQKIYYSKVKSLCPKEFREDVLDSLIDMMNELMLNSNKKIEEKLGKPDNYIETYLGTSIFKNKKEDFNQVKKQFNELKLLIVRKSLVQKTLSLILIGLMLIQISTIFPTNQPQILESYNSTSEYTYDSPSITGSVVDDNGIAYILVGNEIMTIKQTVKSMPYGSNDQSVKPELILPRSEGSLVISLDSALNEKYTEVFPIIIENFDKKDGFAIVETIDIPFNDVVENIGLISNYDGEDYRIGFINYNESSLDVSVISPLGLNFNSYLHSIIWSDANTTFSHFIDGIIFGEDIYLLFNNNDKPDNYPVNSILGDYYEEFRYSIVRISKTGIKTVEFDAFSGTDLNMRWVIVNNKPILTLFNGVINDVITKMNYFQIFDLSEMRLDLLHNEPSTNFYILNSHDNLTESNGIAMDVEVEYKNDEYIIYWWFSGFNEKGESISTLNINIGQDRQGKDSFKTTGVFDNYCFFLTDYGQCRQISDIKNREGDFMGLLSILYEKGLNLKTGEIVERKSLYILESNLNIIWVEPSIDWFKQIDLYLMIGLILINFREIKKYIKLKFV